MAGWAGEDSGLAATIVWTCGARMNGEAGSEWRVRTVGLATVGGLVAILIPLSFFTVDTSEYAIVTQFGDPVQVITNPGLGLKYPYQSVTKFDNRLFIHSPALSEFLTVEKTAVVASTAVLWRIADPKKFFKTVFNQLGAESRLSDILFAELGAAIGRNPLSAFFSTEPGTYRAEAIIDGVAEKIRAVATRDYGITVEGVKLQRLDFPERNRLSVFNRMRSERVRISMKYRSEGEEESLKIRAESDQEKARILAEAFKIAQQHRGEGEAEAARIYAESLSAAPDFYRFLRTMEASRKFFEQETTLVLPVDSELFRLLYDSEHYSDAGSSYRDIANQKKEDIPTSR